MQLPHFFLQELDLVSIFGGIYVILFQTSLQVLALSFVFS